MFNSLMELRKELRKQEDNLPLHYFHFISGDDFLIGENLNSRSFSNRP